MATKAKKPSQAQINAARIKALQKLGLAKSYDPKAALTKSQQNRVSKLTSQYKNILEYRSEYVAKDISSYSKKAQAQFKKAGLNVIDGKVYLRKEGYDRVKIDWTITDEGKGRPQIVRTKKGGIRQEEPIFTSRIEAMNWRDRVLQEYKDKGIKPGNYIGTKFYDNGHVRIQLFTSIESVFDYFDPEENAGGDVFHPHHPGAARQELLNNLHLVRIISPQSGPETVARSRAANQDAKRKTAGTVRNKLGIKSRKTGKGKGKGKKK